MKKGGLARALQARKELDKEPEPRAAVQKPEPTKTKAKTPARFHTTYYPPSREFYDDVRIALIREGKGRDFNELVNGLLAKWLDAHGE